MDKLKYIKLENEDGSYSSSIPLAVDGQYVDINGETLIDTLNTKANKTTVDAHIAALESEISTLVSGTPKGSYETVAALVSANPETGVYVVQADGHAYSWTKNASSAIDLGAYQAVVSDTYYSLHSNDISNNSISITALNPVILKDLYLNWGNSIDIVTSQDVKKEDNCYYWITSNDQSEDYSELKRTSTNEYDAYKYILSENTTYQFDGADWWQSRGLIVIDTLKDDKVVFSSKHSTSAQEPVNLIFTADRPGLLAIMSVNRAILTSTSESTNAGWRWKTRPRLRTLTSITKEIKDLQPQLLWTWDHCYLQHTSNATQILRYSDSNYYTTKVYELKKGYTYVVKGYNYGTVDLCYITNKTMTTILENSWAEHTGYTHYRAKDIEYTPTEDCYLFLCQYINTTDAHYEYLQKNRCSLYIKNNLIDNTTPNDYINFNTLKDLNVKTYIELNPEDIAEEIIDYGYIDMSYQEKIGEFLNSPQVITGYGDYIIRVQPGEIYNFKTRHSYRGTAWGVCSKDKILLRATELTNSGLQTMVEETLIIEPGEYYLVISSREFRYLRKVTSFDVNTVQKQSVLHGLKICYEGDSLTESRLNTSSVAYNGGAYAKLIADKVGGTYVNKAVGGGTLVSQPSTTKHSVYDSLGNLPTDADIYVFSGGINDYWGSKPLGTVTTGYTDTINPNTICGALEGIFRYTIDNFLGKPILFVITHKVTNTHLTPNSQGYTFQDVVDKIIAVCKKYSIPYYNAFDESGVNGGIESQKLEFMTAGASGEPDGCHINEKGYGKYYVPQIIAKLESMVNLDYLDDDE